MKMLVRALAIGSLFAVAVSPLAAQGVNGRWITEFDRMVRNENGNVSTGDKARARLVLEQRGDCGTISGNKVSLSTQVEARRNINGEESVQTMTIGYDFTVDGDKLQGTTTAKASDMQMPARPFSAWREPQPRS